MTSKYDLLAMEHLDEVMNDDGSVMEVDSCTSGYVAAATIYALLSLSESVASLKPVAANYYNHTLREV